MSNELNLSLEKKIEIYEREIKDKNQKMMKKRKLNEESGEGVANKRREPQITIEVIPDLDALDKIGSKEEPNSDLGLIFVANLKYEVTDDDLWALFESFGLLRRAALNYNIRGRSEGTALVVFERKSDAKKAMNTVDGQQLDGRTLRLKLIGDTKPFDQSGSDLGSRITNSKTSAVEDKRKIWTEMAKNYDLVNYGRSGAHRRSGHSRDYNDLTKVEVTIEDLDEELDSYTSQRKASKK